MERGPASRPRGRTVADGGAWLEAVDQAAARGVTAALTGPGRRGGVTGAVERVLAGARIEASQVAAQVLDRALADPRLAEQLPTEALRVQLVLTAALIGVEDVSVWTAGPDATPTCRATSARRIQRARRTVAAARLAIEEGVVASVGTRVPTLAVPVSRFGLAHAAVVVRLPSAQERDRAEVLACVAARRVAPVLERLRLLEQAEQREQSLVAAAEKRLVRLGYDLHDGPVQDVVVLSEELRLLTADLEPLVGEQPRVAVTRGLENVREQVCRLADDLRELAQSLETSAVSRRPLVELFEREAAALRRRTPIDCAVDVSADLDGLTDSQRITLYRVVQEALANVAEHSGASTARIRMTETSSSVSLTVTDDGCGFDPAAALEAAVERGRLGIVGMSERVRLLGGMFRVTSAPTRGTTIRVVLARWLPPDGGSQRQRS